jgi:hypothetical protein
METFKIQHQKMHVGYNGPKGIFMKGWKFNNTGGEKERNFGNWQRINPKPFF